MSLTHARQQDGDGMVMVTGAAGFIGARIVDTLAQHECEVLAVVRPRHEPPEQQASATLAVSRRVTTIKCDLLNLNAVASMVATHRPCACIHTAWDISHPLYMSSPANQRWVQASLHLARWLLQHGCGWLGVCGTHIEAPDTTAPPNRYAAAKATLRHRLFDMTRASVMQACWFHIFQPYGPRERSQRLLPSMIAAARQNEPFELKQPNALRDFIHVDDIAAAIVAAYENSLADRFDIGTGCVRSLRDVALLVERFVGTTGCIRWRDRPRSEWSIDSVNRVANIEPLHEATGWRPLMDFESAVHDLVQQGMNPLRASA